MRNLLQEQLIKAGLAKKSKVAQVVRDQARQRHAKSPAAETADRVDARQLQAGRAERDRELSAQRNAQARVLELRAQASQIVATQLVKCEPGMPYAFEDLGSIKRIEVDAAQRRQLASGALVIARFDGGHALLPRAAADKVLARDAAMIVLDNGRDIAVAGVVHGDGVVAASASPASSVADDAFYDRFVVPDDLVW